MSSFVNYVARQRVRERLIPLELRPYGLGSGQLADIDDLIDGVLETTEDGDPIKLASDLRRLLLLRHVCNGMSVHDCHIEVRNFNDAFDRFTAGKPFSYVATTGQAFFRRHWPQLTVSLFNTTFKSSWTGGEAHRLITLPGLGAEPLAVGDLAEKRMLCEVHPLQVLGDVSRPGAVHNRVTTTARQPHAEVSMPFLKDSLHLTPLAGELYVTKRRRTSRTARFQHRPSSQVLDDLMDVIERRAGGA